MVHPQALDEIHIHLLRMVRDAGGQIDEIFVCPKPTLHCSKARGASTPG
jgi:hypothetical protein